MDIIATLPWVAVVAVLAGLLRSVAGWLENALKDGQIDSFEWKQLFGTMIKYFAAVMLLSVGLPIEASVAGAFGLDVVTSAIKSLSNGNSGKK